MTKRKIKRAHQTRQAEKHVRIHLWVMKSGAWKSLAVGPRALLIELYSIYNGENNGRLFFSENDAAKNLNVHRHTAAGWFDALEERGFIRAAEKGSFTQKTRHATRWILTEFPLGSDIATKDFMRWNPPDQNQNTRPTIGHVEAKKMANNAALTGPKQGSRGQKLASSRGKSGDHEANSWPTVSVPQGSAAEPHSQGMASEDSKPDPAAKNLHPSPDQPPPADPAANVSGSGARILKFRSSGRG